MKNSTPFKNILFYSISFILLSMGLFSCSSSQQAYNDGDGIYGNPETKGEVVMVRDTRTDYYQNYFTGENENSQEIFTDIDAYEGYSDTDTVYVDNQYENGNPPWEQTVSSVSINVNVGFGGWGRGGCGYGGYGGYYGGFYGGYGGWGYPCYGYGYGYGFGWGYGWGYGGYYPGYYPPYYPGYYPPYYERSTYGKRYASNTGRINGGQGG